METIKQTGSKCCSADIHTRTITPTGISQPEDDTYETADPVPIGELVSPIRAIARHPNRNRLLAELFRDCDILR